MHLQGSQILDLWGVLFPLNHSAKNGNEIGSSRWRGDGCCPDRNVLPKHCQSGAPNELGRHRDLEFLQKESEG